MSDMNVLLNKALNGTSILVDGELFLFHALFKRYEWNRISKSNGISLEQLFLNKISSESFVMKTSNKRSAGQQKHQTVRRGKHA